MSNYEHCAECDALTGRAGKHDDSLYHAHEGPFCAECYEAWDEKVIAERDQLKAVSDDARIAELQLDADRYRWIEANSTYGIDYRQRPELTLPIYAPDHHEGLDAAIDAAMGEKHE